MDNNIQSIPDAEYFALDRISKHGLDLVHRSPAHYAWSRKHPSDPTPAMLIGSAVHCASLEGYDEYNGRYVVAPEINKRTKAGREEWKIFEQANAGKTILTAEQHELVVGMATAVTDNKIASALLASGLAEQACLFTDPDTKLACKSKIDFISHSHPGLVIDLKTAADASHDAFMRACKNYRYYVQDAFYSHAATVCGVDVKAFLFVVVENKPPHEVAIYSLPDEAKYQGMMEFRRDLETYQRCLETGEWPGYPTEVQMLDWPFWCQNVSK